MDDLDRLAFRVARTVRTTYPHLMEHGFTLSDLEERLAPYPEARREMASGGPDGYELTVLRLLAGERGYLVAEPELQEACRRAMQMASPTVSIVRTWAGSTLTLRQQAFSLAAERGSLSPAAGSASSDPDQVFGMSGDGFGARNHSTGRVPVPTRASVSANAHAIHAIHAPHDSAHAASPTPNAHTCACHFCGGSLPSARTLKFCPYCGLDLTVRHCPACSTELERNWRFCVTCGRQAEDAEPMVGSSAAHDGISPPATGLPPRPGT